MRYFAIMVDAGMTVAQRDLISNHINQAGCGWWHYIQHAWLITDPRVDTSSDRWLDEVSRILGNVEGRVGKNVVVLEVASDSRWAAFAGYNAHPWLREQWSK